MSASLNIHYLSDTISCCSILYPYLAVFLITKWNWLQLTSVTCIFIYIKTNARLLVRQPIQYIYTHNELELVNSFFLCCCWNKACTGSANNRMKTSTSQRSNEEITTTTRQNKSACQWMPSIAKWNGWKIFKWTKNGCAQGMTLSSEMKSVLMFAFYSLHTPNRL